jgi:predicted nucleotidyltransferase
MNKIQECFEAFIDRISLDETEKKAALASTRILMEHVSHCSEISQCIMTGSMVRSTAIKQFSDVDVIAVLDRPATQQLTVNYSLDLLVKVLSAAGHEAIVSGATVSVSLADKYLVDFLPAFDSRDETDGRYNFDIPRNDRKGWLKYSPEDQSRRISFAVQACGPGFKKLVRAMKWWARIQGQNIESYELEIIACETFTKELLELPRAAADFFQGAILFLGPQVNIKAPGLIEASSMARQACELQDIGDTAGSTSLWRRIFGEQFPIIVCRDHLDS